MLTNTNTLLYLYKPCVIVQPQQYEYVLRVNNIDIIQNKITINIRKASINNDTRVFSKDEKYANEYC